MSAFPWRDWRTPRKLGIESRTSDVPNAGQWVTRTSRAQDFVCS
jgi:hypothetical protein